MNEKHRVYGKTKLFNEEELKVFFHSDRLKYIDIVLLFGSRATGSFHQRSDYDFAILVKNGMDDGWGTLSKVWVDIGEVLKIDEIDYDVVDLSTITPQMKDSIKKSYKIIKGEGNDISRILI